MDINDVNFDGLLEFLNDGLFTSIFLKIYHKLPTSYGRDYLEHFLIILSTIYVYDFYKSKYLGNSKISNTNKKFLEDIRVNTLKLAGSLNSNKITRKISEMGIDFKNDRNDCVITCSQNRLYDINFRNWYPNNDIKFKNFSYNLISNCDLLLEKLLEHNNVYNLIICSLDNIINNCAVQINLDNFNQYSYSSRKMFIKANINDEEKILILQYYGFLKCILYFESVLNSKIAIIEYNNIKFNSTQFFIKLKSVFIDAFFDAIPKENSILYNNIKEYTDKNIPDLFWKKNRKIRKNIHYKDYEKISNDEYEYVKKYQEIYIKEITSLMNEQLNIEINSNVKFATIISKIVGRYRKNNN